MLLGRHLKTVTTLFITTGKYMCVSELLYAHLMLLYMHVYIISILFVTHHIALLSVHKCLHSNLLHPFLTNTNASAYLATLTEQSMLKLYLSKYLSFSHLIGSKSYGITLLPKLAIVC